MSVESMAIVAGVILAVLAVVPIVLAIMPPRQPDPQRGMAVGCLMMFSFATLVPGGLLAWGHFGGHPGIVKTIFWILAAIVGYVAVMATAMTIVRYRKARRSP
jgi:hypothetical protein